MENKSKNLIEQNMESSSKSAGTGFDSAGKPIQTLGTVPAIGLAIIIAVVSYFLIGSMFTPIRNCIGNINGTPECSDCTTKLMKTTVNGKSYGRCTANPGTGKYSDQCSLNCSEK